MTGIVAPALPVLVDHVRRTTERVSGSVRALVARSPKAAIVAAVTVFVLLGVAIGYAAGNKSTDKPTSGEAGARLEDQRFPVGTGGDPDSLRARAAPRDSMPRRPAAAPVRRTSTGVRRQARTGDRDRAAAPVTTELTATDSAGKAPAADSVATPRESTRPPAASGGDSAAALPVLDSAAARASATAASGTRTNSPTDEPEALRRELERRRARLDSIARRVQELKPDKR